MIVSLDDMKQYLGIADNVETYDDFLTEQLGLIQESVESYCRRKFEQATYVQKFYKEDNPPSRRLDLFHFPVQSITSVVEDSGTPLSASLYRLNKARGSLLRPDAYFFYATETAVTFVAGYASGQVPKPIVSTIKSLVQERYNKKVSGTNLDFGSDVQRISIPGTISVDFDYSLANNDRSSTFGVILGNHVNVLDSYRSERAVIGSGKLIYIE